MRTGPGGVADLLGQTATDAGTVDAAVTADGDFLYVQTGATGSGRRVPPCTLTDRSTAIGSVLVPGAVGGEGIVAI